MDQNQTVDNDLQKAIDNITNNTNSDPVFSDPVAAPSSIPEGDTSEINESVGPFPESNVGVVTPPPEPIAPLESMAIPELNALTPPAPEVPATPPTPEPTPETMPETASDITPEPTSESIPTIEAPSVETTPQSLSTTEVKKAALRDLVPLLNKINMDQSQRFKIYRDIFNELRDYTVLEPAYQAAREIPDEKERAEALLYLVETINKM